MSVIKGRNFRHLNAFILLILTENEFHGGGIYKALCESLPQFDTDTGAVYRCLQKLEQNGSVEAYYSTEETGKPRKIYRITDLGWLDLDKWEDDIKFRLLNLNYFLHTYEQIKKKRTK